jgi:hypothetical protein
LRLAALDVVLEVVEKLRSDADELDAKIHIQEAPDDAAGLERRFDADSALSVVNGLDIPAVGAVLMNLGIHRPPESVIQK